MWVSTHIQMGRICSPWRGHSFHQELKMFSGPKCSPHLQLWSLRPLAPTSSVLCSLYFIVGWGRQPTDGIKGPQSHIVGEMDASLGPLLMGEARISVDMRVTQDIWPLFPLRDGLKTQAPKLPGSREAGEWQWTEAALAVRMVTLKGRKSASGWSRGSQVSWSLFRLSAYSAFSLTSPQLCYQPVFCSNGDSHSTFFFF